jgi:hypothetical protein
LGLCAGLHMHPNMKYITRSLAVVDALPQSRIFLITCDQVHIYDSDDDSHSVWVVARNFLKLESLLVRKRTN